MLLASLATLPPPPRDVAAVLERCPETAREHLQGLRALIFTTAADLPDIGPLTETLKWGEPAYLPKRPRQGTTIRLGWTETGDAICLFVHCQTTLIQAWRDLYEDDLHLIGNRELRLPTDTSLPRAALQHCIAMALTYHSRKTAP